MKIAHNYFVYIVECSDKSYYIGVTNDLDRRLWEHNNDNNTLAYTYKRRPVILKFFQHFQDINEAIEFEKQIKGWSRKKKEALFIEDWEEIKKLAKSHSAPSSTSSD
jgi:putative endonuclease